MIDPLSAIGLGIATNMATNLLGATYRDFFSATLGPPEQRELQKVFSHASERFVEVLFQELESFQVESLRDVFDKFISNPKAANALVGIAFKESEAQIPYKLIEEAFHEAGFDSSTLPLNFYAALATYVEALSLALDAYAMRSDSAIYNWVSIGKLRAAQDIRTNNSELLQVLARGQTEIIEKLEDVHEDVHQIKTALSEQSKPSSKMYDYIQAGMEGKISNLSLALSKEKDKELERARELFREGKLKVANQSIEGLMNDENWDEFEDALKAKIYRIKASWLLNACEDIDRAGGLIEKARSLDPSFNMQVQNALFLHRKYDVEAAMKELEQPNDLTAFNFKAILTLVHKGANAAIKLLNDIPKKYGEDAETKRVKALAYLSAGKPELALAEAKHALDEKPEWNNIKRTFAQINFFNALISDIHPKNVILWPDPISEEFVRTDPEGLQHLRIAAEGFDDLLARGELTKEEKSFLRLWRLACLALDPERRAEAEEFFSECVSEHPNDPRFLIWGLVKGYETPEHALDDVLGELDPTSGDYVEFVNLLVPWLIEADRQAEAKPLLENARAAFESSGNSEPFLLRQVQVLCANDEIEEATVLADKASRQELRDQLKVITLNSLAEKTKNQTPILNHLKDAYDRTGDARYLIDLCERNAILENWEPVADLASELATKLTSSRAIRLASIALGNTQRREECLRLLENYEYLFPGGILPSDLSRLRITLYRMEGNADSALKEASRLLQREPSAENTIAYLDILLFRGDVISFIAEAKKFSAKEDVSPADLLRIARMVRLQEPNLARSIWRKALLSIEENPTPEIVAGAFFMAFELNLENEIATLEPLLRQYSEEGSAPVKSVSLKELQELQKDWNEREEFINEQYAIGKIPSHFASEALNVPISDIYHGFPERNRRENSPATNTITFSRHGGKTVSDDLLRSLKKRKYLPT